MNKHESTSHSFLETEQMPAQDWEKEKKGGGAGVLRGRWPQRKGRGEKRGIIPVSFIGRGRKRRLNVAGPPNAHRRATGGEEEERKRIAVIPLGP